MEWKLIKVIKETNHKFLNFYTLIYEVKEDNGDIKKYEYYLASRHNEDELYSLKRNNKPDGVMIPCYHIDKEGNISILITSQFRPALNRVVTSLPAGLLDEGDDLFSAAKREAKEEGGVIIDNLELLCPTSPTSSGLSDEVNAVVMGQIIDFDNKQLEEFEDIKVKLVRLEEIKEMLKDEKNFFALNVRLLLNYLILRFGK